MWYLRAAALPVTAAGALGWGSCEPSWQLAVGGSLWLPKLRLSLLGFKQLFWRPFSLFSADEV